MNKNITIFEYDYENDILFFHKAKDYDYEFSIHLDKSVVIDLNDSKNPIGLEILNASKVFKTKKYLLNFLNEGDLYISISEDNININLQLYTRIHNKPSPIAPIDVTGDNNLNIPQINTEVILASS